ncbi:GLUTAMIC ACID-RICH PROTEIN-LIKE [Salix purpurea]|uniref:GLUTAMIC ACID-RICH PROTEIN-LIKE n=1 Tax=Salix purpurea TaxID=77065 RepID=A0A9Q0SKI0_SALPP|nr:GLUTAMIC ACID-RICH PROTEIN-LIKE [Salix purpurea]
MERVRNSVDVSPFLLVEAAGDSEVDSGPATSTTVVADDDDAESCSCDTSDHSSVSDVINGACSEVEAGRVNCNVAYKEEVEEVEEEEVEEGVEVCQSWFGQVHVGLPVKQKPCVSVDSGNESMNEKEKDRLFWEACLAS